MNEEKVHYDVGQMVIHRSNQILAFNKPPGLAIQSKIKPDLCQLANAYAKRKLFTLHRIDQPASGVVLFGRNQHTTAHISEQFKNGEVERIYLAVVKNRPPKDHDTLRQMLSSNRHRNKAYVASDKQQTTRHSQWAKLSYTYLASSDRYHLLRIELNTGKHHQIRAQLAHLGCPIKGDVKYGDRRSNKNRSIHLHAYSIKLRHPVSQEILEIIANLPNDPLWQFFAKEIP